MRASPAANPLSVARPRLRGWLHAWAFPVSVAAGVTLVSVVAQTLGARAVVATGVYALTMSLLFGTSALYHRVTWRPAARAVMKRLDHSMIFMLIAGTYTPFALLVLPHPTGVVVLAVIWSGAAAGAVMKLVHPGGPRWASVPMYLALGWGAIFVLPAMLRAGVAVLVLLVVGGVAYTAGGFIYGLRRPDPAPAVFGYHEVFHLCTIMAALCHYAAVWLAIY